VSAGASSKTSSGHWSQGVVLYQTFAMGTNLVAKYQAVYSPGALLGDGALLADVSVQASKALVNGDNTPSMSSVTSYNANGKSAYAAVVNATTPTK
jgi:hypothetical protein